MRCLSFVGVRQTKLSKRDIAICKRIREARLWLGLTQEACAEQLNIERSTLANYETARTPLRYEIALRFARQMIISEEWLATGRFIACEKAASLRGQKPDTTKEWQEVRTKIFRRQAMDLLSEPLSRQIPHGTLYGDAYDKFLAAKYSELVAHFYYSPRIVLSDSDSPAMGVNLLTALNERLILSLGQIALSSNKQPAALTRCFVRCVFEATDLIFKKIGGVALTDSYLKNLEWLRYCVSDPTAKIGPLFVEGKIPAIDSSELVAN